MKNTFAAIGRAIARVRAGARLGLAAWGITTLVASTPAQALVTSTQIGNFSLLINYTDSSFQAQIFKNQGPINPVLNANQVNLYGLHFGGYMPPPSDWTSSSSANLDGSTNYQVNSTDSLANVQEGSPLTLFINYAPENGFAVPAGIGGEALTGWLPFSINDSFFTYSGFIPAPYSLTHVPTAPVPEPETWALMLAGLGLLGFAARRSKPPAAAI